MASIDNGVLKIASIQADNDVAAGNVSLLQVSQELKDTNALLTALVNYEPISATEAAILKQLLQTVQLDHNGKIIGSSSLSPQSLNNNLISAGIIEPTHITVGGVTQPTIQPNAVTQTFLNEITTPQTVTTTIGSGTTPPLESTWIWTTINEIAFTPFEVNDEILLTAYVQINVNNFYVTASHNALTGSGSSTQIFNLMAIRFRDTISNTVIKEFDINIQLSDLIQTGTSQLGQWAVAIAGTSFAYTIEHIFTGFSDLDIVAEFAGVDMIKQFASGQALTISITDMLMSFTDIAR